MARWITSDLHAYHKRICEYCPESRGMYSNADDMTNALISNINSCVAEDDELIIAGDIGFGAPGPIMEFLKALNGTKVLVWGNHDFRLRKSDEFESMRGLAGVKWHGDIFYTSCKVDGVNHQIQVQHMPPLDWNAMNFGGISMSGHRHSPKGNTDTYDSDTRAMDIGCDGNDLMPYRLEDLVRKMSTRKSRYNGHHDENGNP